jgi:predicted transposase YdaD
VLDEQRAEELMRSYGEELIERGRQQGLARGRQEGRQEGLTRGRAEDVLRILAARGVQVGDEARRHILSCMDLATLDLWFERSLRATTLADVLEGRAG